jgi:hypothetical protein
VEKVTRKEMTYGLECSPPFSLQLPNHASIAFVVDCRNLEEVWDEVGYSPMNMSRLSGSPGTVPVFAKYLPRGVADTRSRHNLQETKK